MSPRLHFQLLEIRYNANLSYSKGILLRKISYSTTLIICRISYCPPGMTGTTNSSSGYGRVALNGIVPYNR